jgi:uncharacterized RmlC-like cupin family protein
MADDQGRPAPTCTVIRAGAGAPFAGKQHGTYFEGVSANSAGGRALCLHRLTLAPGARTRAHLHAGHETAIYVLAGAAETRYGEGLRERLVVRAGDFLYLPAGLPHVAANPSGTTPCEALVARTDPDEQESVVLLPELDTAA